MSAVSTIVPALPTQDLRSEAKDHKRVKNHNSKWAKGAYYAPGRVCQHADTCCAECARRPMPRDADRTYHGRNFTKLKHAQMKNTTSQRKTDSQRVFRGNVEEAVDDSLSDTDSMDTIEDDTIMYSYDAPRGPGEGSGILSHAVTQAIQRHENKETEKIVKEYDLVPDGKDDVEFADADDDFEIVQGAY